MKKVSKAVLIFSLGFFIFLSSCKKETTTKSTNLSISQLVQKIIGTYTGTQYCSYGSGAAGYTYDTTYNASIVISTSDDSTIIMNGRQLNFAGNLSLHQYDFYSASSGGGYNAQFDSSCHTLMYGYWDGGLGGGAGCNGSGSK